MVVLSLNMCIYEFIYSLIRFAQSCHTIQLNLTGKGDSLTRNILLDLFVKYYSLLFEECVVTSHRVLLVFK